MAVSLVSQWQKAWKWFSVQLSLVGAALAGAWAALGDDLKAYIPHRVVAGIAAFIFVGVIVGRLISQQKPQ